MGMLELHKDRLVAYPPLLFGYNPDLSSPRETSGREADPFPRPVNDFRQKEETLLTELKLTVFNL